MYLNENCKILYQDFNSYYKQAFQKYFIQCFYGKDIVMGSSLMTDDENDK